MTNSKKGYVYVLTNPSMPGIVKIGHSMHGGRSRAISIYSTGVPSPFELEFELLTDDAHELELAVHDRLQKYRVSESREFFECFTHDAVEAVLDEFAKFRDLRVICADEESAVIAAHEFASKIGEHPFTVASALNLIDEQAVRTALKNHYSLLEAAKARRKKSL